jgi:hypothetical protein
MQYPEKKRSTKQEKTLHTKTKDGATPTPLSTRDEHSSFEQVPCFCSTSDIR